MELHAERDYRLTLTDFDRYGRLHPASVLGLLQDISEVQVSEMGMGVDALAAEGYLWAVTRVRYEVAGDLSPHQAVTVRTWPHTLTRFSWLRDCSVRDGEGGLLVRATSEWVLVDARSRSPRSCSAASLRRARRSSGSPRACATSRSPSSPTRRRPTRCS